MYSFEEHVNMTLPSFTSNNYSGDVWSSMYARQLEPWLEQFAARQFILIPYLYYNSIRCQLFSALSLQLGASLPCPDSSGDTDSMWGENINSHPSLDEDLSPSVRRAFEDAMKPENERLVQLLAKATGIMLPGYK